MGQDVERRVFTREDRTLFRAKVRQCLDVFARMLRESRFDADRPCTGIEIELNLVDAHSDPALRNIEALEAIADPDFQTELGQFNIEINIPPRALGGDGLSAFEAGIRSSLNSADARAGEIGTHLVMVGVLPTLQPGHLTADTLSPLSVIASSRRTPSKTQVRSKRPSTACVSTSTICMPGGKPRCGNSPTQKHRCGHPYARTSLWLRNWRESPKPSPRSRTPSPHARCRDGAGSYCGWPARYSSTGIGVVDA